MSLHRWSERNELLNVLGITIRNGTHGLIRNLSIDLDDDDSVVVRGSLRSYYGVQLAIHSTRLCGDKHRLLSQTRLMLNVNGSPIDLTVSHRTKEKASDSLSTDRVNRRPQLTTSPSK